MSAILEAPVAAVQASPPPAAQAGFPNPILELPEVRARVWRMPVDVYERLGEEGVIPKRAELIRGIVLEKMPKSPLHRRLTRKLFVKFLSIAPPGHVSFSESPLRIEDSEPEPDVMIVRGEESDFDEIHPTSAALVVEVAVTSTAMDRANAGLYAAAGVPEYWIVLGPEEVIEVRCRPENGVYQETVRFGRGLVAICQSVPGLRVTVDELFG